MIPLWASPHLYIRAIFRCLFRDTHLAQQQELLI